MTGRPRHLGAASALGAIFGGLVIAGSAMAAYWEPTMTLRSAVNLEFQDLAAGGNAAAVGWSESVGPRKLWARTSDTSGASFDPRFRIVNDPAKAARDLGLDTGADSLWAAWAEDRRDGTHPDRWRLMIGQRDIGGGTLSAGAATANQRTARNADIGYGGPRIWIGYQEQVGGGTAYHMKVWRSLSDSVGVDATVTDLGLAPLDMGDAQLAAVPTRGYAVWANPDGIHFRSASVGAFPSYPTTWNAPKLLATGGEHPILGAGGDRVIVAWSQGGDLWVRRSNDRGASFGAAVRLADGSFPHDVWQPEDLDIAGDRAVLVASEQTDDLNVTQRFQSFNGGSSWTAPTSVGPFTFRFDGFVSVGGVTKLCEAWAEEFTGPDPKDQFFRRQA